MLIDLVTAPLSFGFLKLAAEPSVLRVVTDLNSFKIVC
jgi:hypothetical protein